MTRKTLSTVAPLLLALGCSGKLDVGVKATGGAPGTGGNVPGSGGDVQGTGGSLVVDGGGFNAGGSEAIPGAPGERCIPGGLLIEAKGTSAEAEVKTLDRCNEGYSCSAAKVCVPTGGCGGNAGMDCVVYAAEGGRSGTGGADPFSSTGGTSSFENGPAIPQPPITGLKSDGSRLYFTAYGTRDRLGNFNNDGALSARSLADGTMTTIASELPGPIALGVTSSHAYILVDGAPLIGSNTHHRLLRVPLSGGSLEVVQDDPAVQQFTGICMASRAFWPGADGIYTISTNEPVPSFFSPNALPSATDGLYVYYDGGDWENRAVWRMPIDGGAAQELTGPSYPFGVLDGFLYGAESLDNETGLVLDRAPAGGGSWQRIRALGAGAARALQIVGDRYFIRTAPPETGPYLQADPRRQGVLTATFSSSSPPIRLLERAARRTLVDDLWVGTARALFWSDGNKIYSRSVDAEP